MRILGIDPGTRHVGYGLIEVESGRGKAPVARMFKQRYLSVDNPARNR